MTKVGYFENDQLVHFEKVRKLTADRLKGITNRYFSNSPEAVILSNVKEHDIGLYRFLSQTYRFYEVGFNTQYPIKIAYKTPHTLGNDRIAAAAAAYSKSSGAPALVITCGSCIIYDFVDENGNYLGGAISPGLRMRLKALHNFSAKLPLIKPRFIDSNLGVDTETSILSGVINGMTYEVDGFIDEFRTKNIDLSVFLSGGDMLYFEGKFKNSIFAVPNIVLEGLNKILLFNER
ncbi:MAG: type III pantothenate kinase [Bacteroidales bacterium]|nr:type III pantothenate kinase [Bacteroidales bacterium]